MKLIKTKIDGVYVIELERQSDNRGFFTRSYCQEELKNLGIDMKITQCNLYWIICDAIQTTSRNQEFMNTVGTNGARIELPKMFERHEKEDIIKQNEREFYLKYGKYPP